MQKLIFTIICFFILNQTLVFGQNDANSGIIYGDDHVYTLTAPKGWILDNSSGVSQGLHAVFYPIASSWGKAVTVLYTNVVHMNSTNDKNLDNVIQHDIERFKQNAPSLRIEEKERIEIDKKNNKARVFYFLGDSHDNYEAVAYIPEDKVVVLIVLSARNEKEFRANIKAFEELTKSYYFITDKVNY
ncbi:MAG: hypothetical protein HZB54_03065 [Deltaproteobacteria bacterium]|nr:hypothetical protein [Deltaproteobacteria bacterium]